MMMGGGKTKFFDKIIELNKLSIQSKMFLIGICRFILKQIFIDF